MLEIIVIADDLTGAADTGVQFCPYFENPILISHRHLSPKNIPTTSEALAVYTNSRSLTAHRAYNRLGKVARQLLKFPSRRVYKKVDSCLRGNLGAEVDAIVEEMGFALSFIAPAFPGMGRVTLRDIHRVHGTPVAETELSIDPVTPVNESRLSQVVADQSRHRVAHVDLEFIEGDEETLALEISRLVESGVRHVVFDAGKQTHLDKIALLAVTRYQDTLLVGSAGLARGLAEQLQRTISHPKDRSPGSYSSTTGHHLMVCGTTAEPTGLQISSLLETSPYQAITLSSALFLDPLARGELLAKIRLARRVLLEDNLIVRIESQGTQGALDTGSPGKARGISKGLGLFVAAILRKVRPSTLFLSGGDTASAVVDAVSSTGIRLHGEIIPGVVEGTLISSSLDGLPVVTKAGAFGNRDTLVKLHEYWTRRNLV